MDKEPDDVVGNMIENSANDLDDQDCNDGCPELANKIITEIIGILVVFQHSHHNKIPPGLYLAIFNRLTNKEFAESFLAGNGGVLTTDIEEDLNELFESMVTFFSSKFEQNISLLDVPVLGAKYEYNGQVSNSCFIYF